MQIMPIMSTQRRTSFNSNYNVQNQYASVPNNVSFGMKIDENELVRDLLKVLRDSSITQLIDKKVTDNELVELAKRIKKHAQNKGHDDVKLTLHFNKPNFAVHFSKPCKKGTTLTNSLQVDKIQPLETIEQYLKDTIDLVVGLV